MIKVRTSSGHIEGFDKERIINSILSESKLIEKLNGHKKLTKVEASIIANEVEKAISEHNIEFLSAPLIREIACGIMLKYDLEEVRRIYTRVGLPIYDLFKIITKPEIENANLVDNAETAHKYVADKVLKESALLLLPRNITESHLSGDLHIHDLEYFMARTFCMDSKTAIPIKSGGIVSILKFGDLIFHGDSCFLNDAHVITPVGYRRIVKVTRRNVNEGEMLQIKASGGKSIKITKEHRIPINKDNKMIIKRAEDLKIGEVLFDAIDCENFNLRGDEINKIDLVKELCTKVPSELLSNVYVRGLNQIFNELFSSQRNFIQSLESIGIKNPKINWLDESIMPILIFKKICDQFNIKEYSDIKIGVTGSKSEVSPIFDITSDLVKLLAFFVSDGNYNVNSLVITGDDHVKEVQLIAKNIFNSYATLNESKSLQTNILGRKGVWKRAKQVYFGGKIAKLIFRYVFEIPEKSENKRLPNIVYNLNKNLTHDFISALFSCDGTAFYRPECSDCIVNYSTKSEMLKQELALLLISLGMNPQIIELSIDDNNKPLYRIQLNGFRNIKTFSETAKFDNDNQKHIENFLSNVKGIKRQKKPTTIKKIISINSSEEYVYDIFLEHGKNETEHTFFASDGILIHNCMDWDLRNFFFYGLDSSGINKTNVAGPAKNAEVAILHAAKVLGSAQTNYAGGQGFYNFLTFLSPYLKNKEEKEIKQLMQMFLYEISQTMVARGGQVVFSSIQLTPGVPKLWIDKPPVYAGEIHDNETYGDFEREVRLAFKSLIELMIEGDYNGKPFNFPKPEIGFMFEFLIPREQDLFYNTTIPTYDELYELVFKLTAKFGTPYFDNMLPAYRNHGTDSIECYQCCAYSFSSNKEKDDKFYDKLYFKNKIGFSMGAWQVVTINCPRLAYNSTSTDSFIINWSKMVDLSIDIFKEKKKFIDIQLALNRIPFAQQKPKNHSHQSEYPLVDFNELVWVIGIIGIDDVVKYYTGKSMHESTDSFELAQYLCLEMKKVIEEKSISTGMKLVFARTPAETTAQRFAVADLIDPKYSEQTKKLVSGDLNKALDLIDKTKNLPIYYTNGTHVPVSATCTLIDRLKIEEDFFDILDGGNIHHIFISEWCPDPIGLKEFAMNIIKNTKIGYFSFTKVLTACNDCFHVEQGKHENCSKCGSNRIDYISRITGYLSNLKSWNEAKKQEFKDRREYAIMR